MSTPPTKPATAPRRSPRSLLKRWPAMALLAVAGFGGCASLDSQQRKWIFQPAKETWWAGSSAAELMQPVWIDFASKETETDARLHGLWYPHADPKAPVLLYLHGARWELTGSASRIRRMQQLGFSVLGIDYRGFGQSTDVLPSEAMAYEDARAAWEWLGRQHPHQKRYVFGHSLGSAVAVDLAANEPDVSGLILEGSFTSIAAVFGTFKWGWLPIGVFITQRFDAAGKIGGVKAPVLIVHGSEDRLIPPRLGRALFEKAPEPKRFVLVEGGSHHNTNSRGEDQYREALREMFAIGNDRS